MKTKKIEIGSNKITISEGNTKMGHVSSFSVVPFSTCAEGVPCMKECYAWKLCRMYKRVSDSWTENMQTILQEDPQEVVRYITEYIHTKKVKLFRWNVGGDFNLANYFDITVEVARRCPDCKFLAFTKCKKYILREIPDNYSLVFSVWKSYRIHESRKKYRAAYFNDGNCYIPNHAVKCEGDCEKCGKCFNMKKGEAVYFNKH